MEGLSVSDSRESISTQFPVLSGSILSIDVGLKNMCFVTV